MAERQYILFGPSWMQTAAPAGAERATINGGQGIVKPWVQACADAISRATGAMSFGTYVGHDPDISLAIDVFVPNGHTSPEFGDKVAQWTIDHDHEYSIWYRIWRQRIWNFSIAAYWRAMGDRGDDTQNHFDHVHISFNSSGTATPDPATPSEEDWLMAAADDIAWIKATLQDEKTAKAELSIGDEDPSGDEWKDGLRREVMILKAVDAGVGATPPKLDQISLKLDEILRHQNSGTPSGPAVVTEQDKSDIADLVIYKLRSAGLKLS